MVWPAIPVKSVSGATQTVDRMAVEQKAAGGVVVLCHATTLVLVDLGTDRFDVGPAKLPTEPATFAAVELQQIGLDLVDHGLDPIDRRVDEQRHRLDERRD